MYEKTYIQDRYTNGDTSRHTHTHTPQIQAHEHTHRLTYKQTTDTHTQTQAHTHTPQIQSGTHTPMTDTRRHKQEGARTHTPSMSSQCPVSTQMRTSRTDREKESNSARVKRPQQPKEILEEQREPGLYM